MKKRLLFLLFAFHFFAWAQGQVRLQVLSHHEQLAAAQMLGKTVFADGKLMIFDLQENLILEAPVTKDLRMIIDAENANVTFRSSEIDELDFEVNTSVENTLVFNGIPANSVLRIYTTTGTLLKQVTTKEATTTLPINDLPSGTYILQVNNTILKVLK